MAYTEKLVLRELIIHRFRHARPGAHLYFSGGMNVVLGKNGTGKTNLLELISMVLSSDFGPLVDESFHVEYQLDILGRSVWVEVKHEARSVLSLAPAMAVKPSTVPRWSIRVSCADGGERREVLLQDGDPVQPGPWGTVSHRPTEPRFLLVPVQRLLGDGFLEPLIKSTQRIDESLGLFEQITSAQGAPVVVSFWPAHTPDAKNAPDAFAMSLFLSAPLRVPFLAGAVKPLDEDITLDDGALTALDDFVSVCAFTHAQAQLVFFQSRTTDGDVTQRAYDSFSFTFGLRDGGTIRHDALSYGQKRLLAFMLFVEGTELPVVADELVNGLHHGWIEACLTKLQGHQCFLTSQNPLLLDFLTFDDVSQVRRSVVQCRTFHDDAHQGWVWDQLDESAAEGVLRAYDVGLQHVGEILRDRGLW